VDTESSSRRRSRFWSATFRKPLAQPQELGAQVVLHLRAIESILHHQRRDDVLAEEQP